MDFLVTLTQDWSSLRERSDLRELIAAERDVGRQLREEGVLVRIWRLPGQRANVGVWSAQDATELVRQLDRLPLRPWLDAVVVALAQHDLERGLLSPDATPHSR